MQLVSDSIVGGLYRLSEFSTSYEYSLDTSILPYRLELFARAVLLSHELKRPDLPQQGIDVLMKEE